MAAEATAPVCYRCGHEVRLLNRASETPKCWACGYIPDLCTCTEGPFMATDRMRWRGAWAPGTYEPNDVVRDGTWTMVCVNPAGTQARPAPEASATAAPLLPDAPAWSSLTQAIATVYLGMRVAADAIGYLTALRYWDAVGAAPSVSYDVLLRLDPGLTSARTVRLLADEPDDPDGGGWRTLPLGPPVPVWPGRTIDLALAVHNRAAAPVTSTYPYRYQTPNNAGAPSDGDVRQGNTDPSILSVSKLDDDGNDRADAIEAIAGGWQVSGAGLTWTVTDVADRGGYVDLSVTPAVRGGPDEVGPWTFAEYPASPLDYVVLPDALADRPNLRGFVVVDASAGISDERFYQWNEHAYGIDAEISAAVTSSDWDVVSFSGQA